MAGERTFWMIYGLNQRQPTVRHKTYASAQQEAAQLARVVPGVKFFILQAVEMVEKVDVQHKRLDVPPDVPPDHFDPDWDIPF